MTAQVEWEEFTEEDAKLEQEEMASGGTDFWKPKEGISIVRFLPKLKGWPKPFKVTREHYITTPTGRRNYTCPRVFNQPCVQCDHANKLRTSPKKQEQDLAYDLFSKKQVYARLIDRAEPDKGAQIYKFGKMVHGELMELFEDDGDFTHPIKGYDVKIKKVGTTRYDTKYKCKKGKVCELGNMEWIAEEADLHEKWGQPISQEDLAKKLEGTILGTMLDGLPAGEPVAQLPKGPTADDDVWGEDDDEDDDF